MLAAPALVLCRSSLLPLGSSRRRLRPHRARTGERACRDGDDNDAAHSALSSEKTASDFRRSDRRALRLDSDRIILDLRPAELYRAGHLPHSSHFPLSDLSARSFELPPPYSPWKICCVGDERELAASKEFLESKGWRVHEQIDGDDASTWDCQVETGMASERIWQPNELLEDAMAYVLQADPEQGCLREAGVAIDFGCGSGRDAVYMAMQLPESWKVVAMDNHPAALERTQLLAQRQGVKVECVCIDLRKADLSGWSADIAHGHRFLDRTLIHETIPKILNPGGYFIWSHFLEGCEELAPPRRKARQLRRGELREVYKDYSILMDHEDTLVTRSHRVPANFFIAQNKQTKMHK